MEVTQFYLHLASNSSLDKFPNNTRALTEYRVCLAQSIILSGDWKVALTEIHYPHNWNNVQGDFRNRFYLRNQELDGMWKPLIVSPGHYSSITDVIAKVNEVVSEDDRFKDDVQFSFDTLNRKVTGRLQNGAEVYFSDIGQVLGFSPILGFQALLSLREKQIWNKGFTIFMPIVTLYKHNSWEMLWFRCFELSPWKVMTVDASASRLSARTTYLSAEESLKRSKSI